MSYDLKANNENLEDFGFGAFSWTSFLEDCCGTLFPLALKSGQWYCLSGEDGRMLSNDYPVIISNEGFEISDLESKIMARMARNYVAIQRSLDESHLHNNINFNTPEYLKPFPEKISNVTVDRFEEFAEWAENSNGFRIY